MNLPALSLTTLSQMLTNKTCSSRELLDAHVKRVETYNPRLNAIVTMQLEEARKQADAADQAIAKGETKGPLHGIPMTVKDTWDTANMRTTIGVPWLKQNIPSQDATLISRLRNAGAILWGKTNLPFASYDWQSNNPMFGRCSNPWNLGYSPGGSSGGSAASIAAGFSPLELGSDVAGSIRQPSHSCGIYGLRTTEGLLPADGHGHIPGFAPTLRSFTSFGPLARTPEDLRMALEILVDPASDAGKLLQSSPPPKSLKGARIAWTESWGDVPLCQDTQNALQTFLKNLQQAGAIVESVSPPIDMQGAFQSYGRVHGFEYRAALPWWAGSFPVRWLLKQLYYPQNFGKSPFAKCVGQGLTCSPYAYFEALHQRQLYTQQMDLFFHQWDLWITPTAVTVAFPHQRTGKSLPVNGQNVAYGHVAGTFCCPTTVPGHPILTMPVALSQAGLPIGLQLHGRRWHDLSLIHLAEQISAIHPAIGMPDLDKTTGIGD